VYFSVAFEIVDEDAKAELEKKGGGVKSSSATKEVPAQSDDVD
jgi:hypothetical protein